MKRAFVTGVVALALPSLALAQKPAASAAQSGLDPDAPPSTVHLIDDADAKSPIVPRAKDLLGSHVLVGAAVGPAWSLGQLGTNVGARDGFGTGLGFRADAGFGVSRSVVLGAWGSFATYAHGSSCTSCSGRAFGVGPFVRYQLSQGLRFDPWLTLGAGYRQASFGGLPGPRQKFSGIEWLHFELGADYYVLSGLGFGPYGSLSLSSYSTRPTGAGDASVNAELSVGLRFLFDAPGR